jgi:hypothetical protein
VNAEDYVRTGDDQIFVAAFEVRAAKILRGEIFLLQHGAHGAIENENSFPEHFAKGQALLD